MFALGIKYINDCITKKKRNEKKQFKGCCEFRMLKLLMFFIALQICTNPVMSQVISPYNLESAAYSIEKEDGEWSDTNANHSQKILQYKDDIHIVLTHLGANHQARFYLVEREDLNPKYIDIPVEYNVRDFSILGGVLVFCGEQTIPNEPMTSGFIAYVNIEDMFNGLPNLCKYSNIRSVLVVNKIKTYYNNQNEQMVVGIGEQYYGDVIFTPAPEHEVDPIIPIGGGKGKINKKIFGHDNQHNYWYDEAKKYWDCFISYKIAEIPVNNGIDNIYDIYRCYYENRYNVNPVETLRDIVLTDDYICLVSNYSPYEPETCNPENIFLIRRIDKNDFTNQVTNRYDAAPSIGSTSRLFDLIKFEHLTGNDIAFCYLSVSPLGWYSNSIYKIDLNTNPFTTLSSSFIDENLFLRPYLWDLRYLKGANQLLVLKQQSNANGNGIFRDFIYYVSMSNSIAYPYTTIALDVPNKTYDNQPVFWNSIVEYDENHFALAGNIENKSLTIFEKDAYNFLNEEERGCNKLNFPIVQSLDNPETISIIWDMVHCKFLYMINQQQLLVGITFLPSQIITNDIPILEYKKDKIIKHCENEEVNFHFPEDIESQR